MPEAVVNSVCLDMLGVQNVLAFLLLFLPGEMTNLYIWGDFEEPLSLTGPLIFLGLKIWVLDNLYLGWLILES